MHEIALLLRQPLPCWPTGRLARATLLFPRWSSTFTSGEPCTTKPYMVTTPIFYVNGPPHVGHAYTVPVILDVVLRLAAFFEFFRRRIHPLIHDCQQQFCSHLFLGSFIQHRPNCVFSGGLGRLYRPLPTPAQSPHPFSDRYT